MLLWQRRLEQGTKYRVSTSNRMAGDIDSLLGPLSYAPEERPHCPNRPTTMRSAPTGSSRRAGSVAQSLQRPLETFAECLGELS
jgi:hypothetical protein